RLGTRMLTARSKSVKRPRGEGRRSRRSRLPGPRWRVGLIWRPLRRPQPAASVSFCRTGSQTAPTRTIMRSQPCLSLVLLLGCPMVALGSPEVTARARKFIQGHDTRIRPLDIAAGLAWWEANTTGSAEAFKKKEEAQNRIDEALADRAVFAELKAIKQERGQIDDPIVARTIDVL